jgi:hypothetical protein
MKADYWKPHKEALRALTVENVTRVRACTGKTWWTVGELAEECRQRRCRAEHPETGRGYYFDCLPRRIQYALVESALRAIKADRCLGSDDGREVRVYGRAERC